MFCTWFVVRHWKSAKGHSKHSCGLGEMTMLCEMKCNVFVCGVTVYVVCLCLRVLLVLMFIFVFVFVFVLLFTLRCLQMFGVQAIFSLKTIYLC